MGEWLRSVDMAEYEAIFAEKGITGRYLLSKMTEDKAKKLILDDFHLENFMDALAELKQRAAAGPTDTGGTSGLPAPSAAVNIVTAESTPRHTMPTR